MNHYCQSDCVAIKDECALYIFKNDALFLSDTSNCVEFLWDIPFQNQKIKYVVSHNKSKTEVV